MIITDQIANRVHRSYLHNRYIVALIAVVFLAFFTACQSNPVPSGLGTIAGIAQLSDPDPGTGHAGILVYLAGTPYQARTDQQGRYRIDGISAGTYDLIAEKVGYQGQVIEGLLVTPESNNASAPLQPANTLLNKVETSATAGLVDELGSIEGSVLLEGMPGENGGVRVEVDGTAFVTVSSNDGEYRLLNVKPGNYRLSYYRDGYLPYKTPEDVTITTGVTVMQDVALELMQPGDPVSAATVAEAVAAKAVTPDQTEPPPGPNEMRNIVGVVQLSDEAGNSLSDYSEVTVAINGSNKVAEINDQGQFRFDDLTSGTYTLIGTIPDGPVVQIPVDLVQQRSASISVQIQKGKGTGGGGGTVKGRIVLLDMDGNSIEDASGVQVAINGTQALATTAADGSFTVSGVDTGSYSLSASKEGFKSADVKAVEVNSASAVDVGNIEMFMDVDRPRVLSTNPGNNAKDVEVGINLPITVRFSDRMDISTLREAVSLTPDTPFTINVGGTAGIPGSDDTMIISLSNDNPQAPIQFGAQYRITIADTAANISGVTMEKPYNLTFRTDKPGVVSTSPENGANRVYVDQVEFPVLFSFNTRLDPDSINDRTIKVKPDNGISVSTTYNNDGDEKGWTTVRVSTQWQPNTAYTVTVSRRVRALNGQTLGNTPYTLRFRTAPLEIMSMPIMKTR